MCQKGKGVLPSCIGFVGGLGVGATVYCYEHLAKAFVTRGVTPRLIISHADVALVLTHIKSNALDSLADYLASHIDSLERAGADFAAIGAVAAHICAPKLKARIGVPLVDVIDCTRTELTRRGARRVAVLGTKFVMQSDMYGQLYGFDVIRLASDSLERVNANYAKIVANGALHGSGADIEYILTAAQEVVRNKGVDVVVLAGTELSIAFNEADCGFPAIDCARVHLDAIIGRAFTQMAESEKQHE
jgi:aspartate racemase